MILDAAGLRERLRRQTPPALSVYGDDGAGREAAATAAAVLVPIVAHPAELTVLFTQRTSQLRSHSGQVSFPGGRAEPEDASPELTALREAEEEIGLPAERVEIVARLPDYLTRTGFRVTPVVGLLTPPLERNHLRETRELRGETVGYYVMQYGKRRIWGATAGMLVNLYRMLA